MQSRFPHDGWENGVTSARYSVFQGFGDLFEDFDGWLTKATGVRMHGHLFAEERAEYADGQTVMNGALSDSAAIRDYNPQAFLTSLIWNSRGERQCFRFGPRDVQDIGWIFAKDPNAQVSVISGAWAVPLFLSNRNFADLRREAAELQKVEAEHLKILRSPYASARIRIWTMAEFIEAPMEPLQTIIDEIGSRSGRRLAEAPKMVDLTGFGQFLQNLKNQGMHPYLMGDFAVERGMAKDTRPKRKPYLVR
jgi:hypothetical protein